MFLKNNHRLALNGKSYSILRLNTYRAIYRYYLVPRYNKNRILYASDLVKGNFT